MGLVVDTMMLGIVADVGEVGGLLIKGAVLLAVFFLFHRGVQMILFLETSGVILEFGGVLWLLAGDSDGGGLPGTPVASSLCW